MEKHSMDLKGSGIWFKNKEMFFSFAKNRLIDMKKKNLKHIDWKYNLQNGNVRWMRLCLDVNVPPGRCLQVLPF